MKDCSRFIRVDFLLGMRMKTGTLLAVFLSLSFACARAPLAAEPAPQPGQGAPQPDFSPPPVPEFMLRKPAKPLTLEEMKKQADEAAQRARAESEKRASTQKTPAKDGDDRMK
jgi:hypothetical protein